MNSSNPVSTFWFFFLRDYEGVQRITPSLAGSESSASFLIGLRGQAKLSAHVAWPAECETFKFKRKKELKKHAG